jgi:hypothetical protein
MDRDPTLDLANPLRGVAMKMHHTRYYWITVALVVIAFLLTLSEAHGQTAGTSAVFEGRPALAGAQGGQGAQAGPPQGGIGVQGNEAAEKGMRLRQPSLLDDVRQGARDANAQIAADNTDTTARKEVEPVRDRSLAKDERSSVQKGKRAAKRTISRARHGVSEIDSTSSAAATR